MKDKMSEFIQTDTAYVLNGDYTRATLIRGYADADTPLFDALAADRFANDRKTEEPAHYHIWSEMPCFCVEEPTFNLGDYR